MSESNLRGRVKDHLKPAHVQQIENALGLGVPDTYWAFEGIHGWLELKHAETIPVRPTTAIFRSYNHPLSVEQEAWIWRCWKHCPGSVFMLPQIGKETYLVPGRLSYEFNEMTLSDFAPFMTPLKELRAALKSYAVAAIADSQTSDTA